MFAVRRWPVADPEPTNEFPAPARAYALAAKSPQFLRRWNGRFAETLHLEIDWHSHSKKLFER